MQEAEVTAPSPGKKFPGSSHIYPAAAPPAQATPAQNTSISMSQKPSRPPPEVSAEEEPESKRAKPEPPPRVALNPADCNLDFDLGGNGLEGSALHEYGFAYCWSGARATVGINGGKYCFGCKIISEQVVKMADTASDERHLCRIGISRGDEPVGNLGESKHSFGFGGTGKFSTAGKFSAYGVKFGVGDEVICAVDLEDKAHATIGFAKNGKWLGTALKFNAGPTGHGAVDSKLLKLAWASSFFPHILLKNVVVQMQFSVEDGLSPIEGFKPWSSAVDDGNAINGPLFSKATECELMMMVGLPASGKTTWSEKWIKDHPEKRYILLGTNLALDQMKVPGLLRKQNYGERFEKLMYRATKIFDTLLARASKTPRNYIVDQTNVYKSARKRKLKGFADYRKVAVVVFPTPDELKNRAAKRFKEMGKEVPAQAVNQMLANYVLPTSKEMPGAVERFDEVIFTELDRAEAQRVLEDMKRDLQTAKSVESSPYTQQPCDSQAKSVGSAPSSQKPPVQSSSTLSESTKAVTDSGAHFPRHKQDYRSPSVQYTSGSYGTSEHSTSYYSRTSEPRASLPYDGSTYSNYGSTSNPRGSQGSYDVHSGTDYYDRAVSERSLNAVGEHSLYGRTGANDAHMHSNFEKSPYGGGYGYQDSRSVSANFRRDAPPLGLNLPPGGSQSPGYASFDRYGSSLGSASYGVSRVSQADLPSRESSYEHRRSAPLDYGLYGTPPTGARPETNRWHSPNYPTPGYPSSGPRYY